MVIAKLQALCRHMGMPQVAKFGDLAISLSTCSFTLFLIVSLELWTKLVWLAAHGGTNKFSCPCLHLQHAAAYARYNRSAIAARALDARRY